MVAKHRHRHDASRLEGAGENPSRSNPTGPVEIAEAISNQATTLLALIGSRSLAGTTAWQR